jgi:hypothetical protein
MYSEPLHCHLGTASKSHFGRNLLRYPLGYPATTWEYQQDTKTSNPLTVVNQNIEWTSRGNAISSFCYIINSFFNSGLLLIAILGKWSIYLFYTTQENIVHPLHRVEHLRTTFLCSAQPSTCLAILCHS